MNWVPAFLEQLEEVAKSPYAFVAYLAVLLVWAIIALRTSRFKKISNSLHLVPEMDRKALLEKEYGYHLKEGMSATQFLKAQRTAYIFYAFLALLGAIVLIVVLALLQMRAVRAHDPPLTRPVTLDGGTYYATELINILGRSGGIVLDYSLQQKLKNKTVELSSLKEVPLKNVLELIFQQTQITAVYSTNETTVTIKDGNGNP